MGSDEQGARSGGYALRDALPEDTLYILAARQDPRAIASNCAEVASHYRTSNGACGLRRMYVGAMRRLHRALADADPRRAAQFDEELNRRLRQRGEETIAFPLRPAPVELGTEEV